MTVEPLVPDAPLDVAAQRDDGSFARTLDAVADALSGATRAEDAFAYGRAVYERAQADVALAVATATAQRLVQAVQSVLNMQV